MSSPLRLRDFQRAFNRARVSQAAVLIVRTYAWKLTAAWSVDDEKVAANMRRHLDRLITRFGPDAPIESVIARLELEREEAERTDHQTGASVVSDGSHTNPSADTHGGDGNSGEMDHTAETSAPNRDGYMCARNADADAGTPDGTPQAGGCDGLATEASQGSPDGAPDDGEWPAGRGDTGGDEPTQGMGPNSADESRTAGDENAGQLGPRVPAAADCAPAAEHDSADGPAEGDAGAPRGVSEFNGAFLDRRAAAERERQLFRSRIARQLLRELRYWLERDVSTIGGEQSPRIDPRHLVCELAGRSYRIERCRRREVERGRGIIAVDISGSCSVYSAELMGVARALARIDDRLIVVEHVNGMPVDDDGEPIHEDAVSVWLNMTESHDVRSIIWLGDSDGAAIRKMLSAHGVKVHLLDNYTSSYGVARRASRHWVEPWCASHVVGVGGADTVLDGLRIMRQRHARPEH